MWQQSLGAYNAQNLCALPPSHFITYDNKTTCSCRSLRTYFLLVLLFHSSIEWVGSCRWYLTDVTDRVPTLGVSHHDMSLCLLVWHEECSVCWAVGTADRHSGCGSPVFCGQRDLELEAQLDMWCLYNLCVRPTPGHTLAWAVSCAHCPCLCGCLDVMCGHALVYIEFWGQMVSHCFMNGTVTLHVVLYLLLRIYRHCIHILITLIQLHRFP